MSIAKQLGVWGSIASLVGLVIVSIPTQANDQSVTTTTGGDNTTAIVNNTGNIIINHNGESSRGDGVFLYEEELEPPYWNEWWAYPVMNKEKNFGNAEVTIRAEGKSVDIYGILDMNCESWEHEWKSLSDFGESITASERINELIPKQVYKNVHRLFCENSRFN